MRECKCCHTPIHENVAFCPFCGYDPKTDTISASFKPSAAANKIKQRQMRAERKRYGHGIGPGVKKFAFIGLAIVIFTVFYKHNFNPKAVISEVKQDWSEVVSKVKQPWNAAKIEPGTIIPLGAEKKLEPGKKAENFNPSTPLIVEGIVWEGRIPQAIINHKIFNVGDSIEGAKIAEINKKGVVVLYKERSYLLPSSVSKYWHEGG